MSALLHRAPFASAHSGACIDAEPFSRDCICAASDWRATQTGAQLDQQYDDTQAWVTGAGSRWTFVTRRDIVRRVFLHAGTATSLHAAISDAMDALDEIARRLA